MNSEKSGTNLRKKLLILFSSILILSFVSAGDGRTNCVVTQPIINYNLTYNAVSETFDITYYSVYCGAGDSSVAIGNYGDFPIGQTIYASTMPWTYYFVGDLTEGCGGATIIEECQAKLGRTDIGTFYEKHKCYRLNNIDIGFDFYDYSVGSHYEQLLNNQERIEEQQYRLEIGTPKVSVCADKIGYVFSQKTASISKNEMQNKIIRTHALIHLGKSNCYGTRCRNSRLGVAKLPDCEYHELTGFFSGECCDEGIKGLNCGPEPLICIDGDGDGYNITGGECGVVDCDDTNANVNPGAWDACDGVDNDCDGLIDEGFNVGDFCSVGLGACYAEGFFVCSVGGLGTKCNAIKGAVVPEICGDSIDNDCDGLIDEGCPLPNCTIDEDCPIDYLTGIYCSSNNRVITSHRFSCVAGKCIENITTTILETCEFGCLNGNCKNQSNETDTTPPASVTGLNADSKSTNWILWGWNNPTDLDFFQNIIFINNQNIANTSSNFYKASNLNEDTVYTITIHTIDNSGNINDTDVTNTARTNKKQDDEDDDKEHKKITLSKEQDIPLLAIKQPSKSINLINLTVSGNNQLGQKAGKSIFYFLDIFLIILAIIFLIGIVYLLFR